MTNRPLLKEALEARFYSTVNQNFANKKEYLKHVKNHYASLGVKLNKKHLKQAAKDYKIARRMGVVTPKYEIVGNRLQKITGTRTPVNVDLSPSVWQRTKNFVKKDWKQTKKDLGAIKQSASGFVSKKQELKQAKSTIEEQNNNIKNLQDNYNNLESELGNVRAEHERVSGSIPEWLKNEQGELSQGKMVAAGAGTAGVAGAGSYFASKAGNKKDDKQPDVDNDYPNY